MSQRRIRGNQPATVNYKEMYEEAEQELADLQERLDQIATIAAPDVDHERIERIEQMLVAVVNALLTPDQRAEVEKALEGENPTE